MWKANLRQVLLISNGNGEGNIRGKWYQDGTGCFMENIAHPLFVMRYYCNLPSV
jgi:hypothetical protein